MTQRNIFSVVMNISVITAVAFLLYHQTRDLTLSSILRTIEAISVWRILCCLLLTMISFFCLALYDTLSVKGLQQKISVWMSLFTGATSNAIANTLGFHAMTGGAWRYRVYATKEARLADLTGLNQTEAQARVDQGITKANADKEKSKAAADSVRKAAASFSIFTALAMMIGAFVACVSAALGGKLRDEHLYSTLNHIH